MYIVKKIFKPLKLTFVNDKNTRYAYHYFTGKNDRPENKGPDR